jgi:Spy/CpxP family protein refolding chaperone
MTRLKWLGVVLPVVLGATGAGCAGSEPEAPVTAAAAGTDAPGAAGAAGAVPVEDDSASVELHAHHRHHHGGFVGFVTAAVETIGVTPDQQAGLDKIKADFKAKVEPERAANGAVMNALADGIAAGAIDQAKIDAAVAGVGTAAGQIHAATADALNQLHALLRPEQRAALVDKINAHWGIWKEANAGDQATDNTKPGGHIAHLATEIGLSPDQVTKTQANLSALPPASRGPFNPAAAEAHMQAFAAAFVGNTFDAKTLTTSDPANTSVVSWGAGRMVRFYQALTPVLTADQRTKVAAQLREHANEP